MFGRRCKHQWEFVGAKYNPRPDELRNAKGSDPDMLREAIYGFTALTQRCTECGWVEVDRVAGKPDLSKFGLEWGVVPVERQGVEQ